MIYCWARNKTCLIGQNDHNICDSLPVLAKGGSSNNNKKEKIHALLQNRGQICAFRYVTSVQMYSSIKIHSVALNGRDKSLDKILNWLLGIVLLKFIFFLTKVYVDNKWKCNWNLVLWWAGTVKLNLKKKKTFW